MQWVSFKQFGRRSWREERGNDRERVRRVRMVRMDRRFMMGVGGEEVTIDSWCLLFVRLNSNLRMRFEMC